MSEQYNAELIMKFQNVKSLKDYGGMDYDIAQECVEIAIKESESIAIEFAEWRDFNSWKADYTEQKDHTIQELFAKFMAERQSQ